MHHLHSGFHAADERDALPAEAVAASLGCGNPTAVAELREGERGILPVEAVRASDVVITMGRGDTCPVFPGKRYLDWQLDGPAGQSVEAVRPIRDAIETCVRALISEVALG